MILKIYQLIHAHIVEFTIFNALLNVIAATNGSAIKLLRDSDLIS